MTDLERIEAALRGVPCKHGYVNCAVDADYPAMAQAVRAMREEYPLTPTGSLALEAAEAEIARLRAALEEIKREQGKVCQNFELCYHESCRSSYTAWAIADAALAPSVQQIAREFLDSDPRP